VIGPAALAWVSGLFAVLVACAAARAEAHLSLALELDPRTRQFSAVAELRPGTAPFRFLLHESLSVQGVFSGSTSVNVRAARTSGGLREWRVESAAHQPLRIEYGGMLPRLDAALDHREVLRALPPMASEQGSFLGSASGWYPAPGEAFTYRVRLAIAGGHKALVAGRLVDEELEGPPRPLYRATFEFATPTDGIALMAGPYEVRERSLAQADGRMLRLRTYFFAELAPLADDYLEDSRRYIELFSRIIGPYPFTEFSVVASPLPTGFGMPTLTYIGATVLRLPFIRATSLGHEVLHNWWGNGVRVDYQSGNWAEGLTTFMADYGFRERESAEAAREMRLAWLRDFAAIPPGADVPLVSFRSRTHGAAAALGYGKAAMVFLMARDLIGEEAFGRAVRQFWERHRFETASWEDLRTAFEQASGRSLDDFFRQWLARPGGPAVRIVSARAKPGAKSSRAELELVLEQSDPPYRLRLPLELHGEGSAMRHVEIERARQSVTLDVDARVTRVRLDPELRIWRLLEREELPPILRQWIIARSPRLLPVSGGAAREAAQALAARLFETPHRTVAPEALSRDVEPILLVGLHADVDAALRRLGLPPRPQDLQVGSAQVWTIATANGAAPVAVISIADARAAEALLRPLPHYGAQSYLVFEGSRVMRRGVWPPASRWMEVKRAP
jgi:aminopeptidase N